MVSELSLSFRFEIKFPFVGNTEKMFVGWQFLMNTEQLSDPLAVCKLLLMSCTTAMKYNVA